MLVLCYLWRCGACGRRHAAYDFGTRQHLSETIVVQCYRQAGAGLWGAFHVRIFFCKGTKKMASICFLLKKNPFLLETESLGRSAAGPARLWRSASAGGSPQVRCCLAVGPLLVSLLCFLVTLLKGGSIEPRANQERRKSEGTAKGQRKERRRKRCVFLKPSQNKSIGLSDQSPAMQNGLSLLHGNACRGVWKLLMLCSL